MRLRHRLNVPASELAGRRQTSVSAVEPPNKTGALHPRLFWIGLFSFAVACLKPVVSDLSDLSDLSDTRSGNRGGGIFLRTDVTFGTSGTCGTRMRRNQKIFFIR